MKNTTKKMFFGAYLAIASQSVFAQGWNLVWREDFGVAEDTVIKDFPDPTMTVPNHCFYENQRVCTKEHQDPSTYQMICDEYSCTPGERGTCGTIDDGYYGIANSTWWSYNRFKADCGGDGNISHFVAGRDHTGNKNGAMLIINTGTGEGEPVYEQEIEFDLCDSKKYRFVIYTASITNEGYNPVYPNLTIKVSNSTTNELIEELETGDIPNWQVGEDINFKDEGGFGDETAVRDWAEYYVEFTAKDGDKLSLQVLNNCKGGSGNDFVLDDISLLRYDGDVDVPDPIISATTITESSATASNSCSYLATFGVPEDVLTQWKKIYKYVYFLWQKSTDDGVNWTNVSEVSGEDKIEVQIEMDKSESSVFRVIITGSDSDLKTAKEQAEYIAENGGPKGGCAYFSISNTLSANPEADCTYSSDLEALFKEDFGTPGDDVIETSYTGLDFLSKGLSAGNYAITSDPKLTEKNSWDGVPSLTDHTGNDGGGMLYCRINSLTTEPIYTRTISGPFCDCKSYIFKFNAIAPGSGWDELKLTAKVLDSKGTEIATLPISKGNGGKDPVWGQYELSFDLPQSNNSQLTLQIFSAATNNESYGVQAAIDDIALLVCGEHAPQDSIYINNTIGLLSMSDFDCNAQPAPTINLSSMSEWAKKYPNAGFVWQSSTDGGLTWALESERSKEITYQNDEGGTKLYRAIVAETYALAKSIAQGTNTDGCGMYLYTNTVSLTCREMCEFGDDKLVLWKDDFGSVPSGTRKTSSNLKGHTFTSDMSKDINDGYYAVVSRVQDAGSWFAGQGGSDHTGNEDGGFIVINVNPDYKGEVIYEQELGFTTCENTMYYFSLWAGSISKKVANGDASGVLCNLLLEIVDASTGDVLGSIETGDIPNATSMTSTIPWTIYGVSFMAMGEKVVLKIIDNAGNGKKGNDLAIDDISLIACQTKAPSIELQADGDQDVTGICGETVTLSLPDMSEWEAYYPNTVYTLWQKSTDGGENWETMEGVGGLEVQSIEVTLEKNKQMLTYESEDGSTKYDSLTNVGVMYRAIVAGPEEDVTSQIATQGYPDNGCYLYAISNISTLKCDCVDPIFKFDNNKTKYEEDICETATDEVTISVVQTGTTNTDSLNWYSRTDTTEAWVLIEDNQATTLSVLPADTTYYMFVAVNDDCHSDSLYATINVHKQIKLDTLSTDTLCVGNSIEVTAVLADDNEGTPTKYIWNNTSSTSDTYTSTVKSADNDITLQASDGVCTSEEIKKTIVAEEPFEIASSIAPVEVCGYDELNLESQAVAPTIEWFKSVDGGTTYTKIEGATEATYTFTADVDATYKAVASGVSCPSKEVTAEVTVTLPETLTASIDGTEFCESGTVNIHAAIENVFNLVLVSRTDTTKAFELAESVTLAGTETEYDFTNIAVSQSTQFRVQTPSSNCPTAASDIFTVTIDKPVVFTLASTPAAICESGEIQLTATLDATSGTPNVVTLTRTGDSGSEDLSAELTSNAGVYKYAGTVNETSTYTLSMTPKVCTASTTDDATVTVEIPAQLTLTSDLTQSKVCVNTPVTLTLTTNTDVIEWQTSTDGKTFAAAADIASTDITTTQKPQVNTWYKVVSAGTGVCGAVETKVVAVEIEDSVRFSIDETPVAICRGENVSNTIVTTTGTITAMAWSNGTADVSATSQLTDAPDADVTYTATVSGDVCAPVSKTFAVSVEQPATINAFTISDNAICVNNSITLTLDQTNAAALIWEEKTEGGEYATFSEEMTTTQTRTPLQTTTYRVRTGASGVCKNSGSSELTVTVEDSLRITVPDIAANICEGSPIGTTATLVSGTPTAITWVKETASGASTTVSTNMTLTDLPDEASTYTLTIDGSMCPSVTKTFATDVEKQAKITMLRASETGVCVNSDVTLNVSQQNATELVWEKADESGTFSTISEELADNISVNVAQTSTYRVSSKGAVYCIDVTSNTVTIKTEDSVNVSLPDMGIVCPDVENTITATITGNPISYNWSTKTNEDADYRASSESSLTYTDKPTQTTTYKLQVMASYCPSAEATTTIDVYELPDLTVTASASEICLGEEVTLTTDFDYPEGIVWKSRFPGQVVTAEIDAASLKSSQTPISTLEYMAEGTTEGGCSVKSEFVKVIVDEPVAAVAIDTTICEGAKAKLTSSPYNSDYKYTWSEDASYADTLSSQYACWVQPEETKTYYLNIKNGVCEQDLSMTVNVSSTPHITSIENLEGRNLTFGAEGGTGAYEFDYGFGWTSSNVFENIRFATTYKAYVRDEVGCQSDTTYQTETYDITVPTFFSPNGDIENETFKIVNIDKYPDSKIVIYDRFGKKLLETTGGEYGEGWDGTYNGHQMPSTDYWYEIYVYDIYKTYTGHFTLLRGE